MRIRHVDTFGCLSIVHEHKLSLILGNDCRERCRRFGVFYVLLELSSAEVFRPVSSKTLTRQFQRPMTLKEDVVIQILILLQYRRSESSRVGSLNTYPNVMFFPRKPLYFLVFDASDIDIGIGVSDFEDTSVRASLGQGHRGIFLFV